jgi:hypothetical protein
MTDQLKWHGLQQTVYTVRNKTKLHTSVCDGMEDWNVSGTKFTRNKILFISIYSKTNMKIIKWKTSWHLATDNKIYLKNNWQTKLSQNQQQTLHHSNMNCLVQNTVEHITHKYYSTSNISKTEINSKPFRKFTEKLTTDISQLPTVINSV